MKHYTSNHHRYVSGKFLEILLSVEFIFNAKWTCVKFRLLFSVEIRSAPKQYGKFCREPQISQLFALQERVGEYQTSSTFLVNLYCAGTILKHKDWEGCFQRWHFLQILWNLINFFKLSLFFRFRVKLILRNPINKIDWLVL